MFFRDLVLNDKIKITFRSKKFISILDFTIVILINLVLEAIHVIYQLDLSMRIVISNIQIITLLIASYKFLLKGFLLSLLFNIASVVHIYINYLSDTQGLDVQILSFRVLSIILSGLICLLAFRQKTYINKIENNSYLDGITEVFNHRYFQERLDKEFLKAKRTENKLGLIMIDIDNFKKYNDAYGHRMGDLFLKESAEAIKESLRPEDIVCRFGGDEFVIILPGLRNEEMISIASHIKIKYENFISENKKTKNLNISMSLGYSIFPNIALSRDELLSQAENALYHAKQSGRNNIKIYKDVFTDIKTLLNSTEGQLLASLRTLLTTVSAKDKYTLGHSERVMDYSLKIGQALGLNEEDLKVLKISALLHDVGKVEIPQEVLNKKERLTDEEFALIKMHPIYSAEIVEPLSNIGKLYLIVKHHHERIDGFGYPDGIRNEEIPLGARILAVADSFDAMMSNRPYREPLSKEDAILELKRCSGKQFDPKIADLFIKIMSETD